MKSLTKKIVATLLVFALMIPSTTVFAANTNNNQAVVQTLAQQIVAQQVAAFQAQGQVLTPEQLAELQKNALAVATQQAAALQAQQAQAQQAAALQAQQAAALQAQQAAALQAQQAAALQAQQKAAQLPIAVPNSGAGRIVYIASSGAGERYHVGPNCPSLRNGATAISLDQAIALGRTPCQMRNCR